MKKCFISVIAAAAVLCLAGCGTETETAGTGLGEDEARALALEMFSDAAEEDISECKLNEDDPESKKYEICIENGDIKGVISIAADDGTVLYAESEPAASRDAKDSVSASGEYSAEEVKAIALSRVTGSKDTDVHLCIYSRGPDEPSYYSVMIDHEGKTHAFSIDAATGEIFYQEIFDEIIE